MIRTLPEWYIKAEEKLKDTIIEIANELHLDFNFILDSKGIEEGQSRILNRLVAIYENVDVEQRERMEKFEEEIKKKNTLNFNRCQAITRDDKQCLNSKKLGKFCEIHKKRLEKRRPTTSRRIRRQKN